MGSMFVNTPIGLLNVTEKDGAVIEIKEVCKRGITECPDSSKVEDDSVLGIAVSQIKEYFRGQRTEFTFPVNPEGTPFRKSVWNECRKIPYGQVASYGAIAAAVGCPKGSRAVGGALHYNPLLLVVPCHRIVSAKGEGGFRLGNNSKRFLLDVEQGKGRK